MKSLIITILSLVVASVSCRVLNECQLALEFDKLGVSREDLANYVCIAEHESHGNTSAIRGPGLDGSYDYGLFLVSDNYWCDYGKPGGGCLVECDDLTSDDVTAALNCAEIIKDIHGYTAWQSWSLYCKRRLPDLSRCFE